MERGIFNLQKPILYPPIPEQVKLTKFSVKVTELVLFQKVDLIVYLFDENDVLINSVNMSLSGNDYSLWNNDDTYIINYVKRNL